MIASAAAAARHPVEELAEDFLTRYRQGQRPSLSEYVRQFPDVAGELADIIQALLVLEGLGVDGEFTDEPAAPLPERLGEYRLVREIGRGGMGVVYEAEQGELGRRVALKILPAAALLRPTHLERFRREARAAARLHHTNIVPVFGVGVQAGIHYYAMQYIDGQGLDTIVDELRRQKAAPNADTAKAQLTALTSSGAAGSSEYHRSVARMGVQVAAALAHAHAHGVLHRDVKPGNVLIDEHGTAWLSDFGLAQHTDDGPLTSTGGFVGTLRYLAPERLQGEGDARSDVYSLGATLYELLTLQPMFAETDRVRLLRQVTDDHPPPPRRVVASIPKDLETIVLKATAKLPDDRYGTAAEVGEDLQRFLADRPVTARPVPMWEKVRRWMRRNPIVSGAFAAVVLSLSIGFGATWSQWRRAEAETTAKSAALDRAELSARAAAEQAQRAHAHARRTLEMLEELMHSVAARLGSPGSVDARKFLFEQAIRVHDKYMAQTEAGSFDRVEMSQLATRVGRLHKELRNSKQAEEAFQRALALVEPEASAPTGNVNFRAAKGKTQLGLGGLLYQLGRKEEFAHNARENLALYRALHLEQPASREFRHLVATALNNVAIAVGDRSETENAILLYRESNTIYQALANEQADDEDAHASLLKGYRDLALEFRKHRRWSEAIEAARTAFKLAEEMLIRFPHGIHPQDRVADSAEHLGTILMMQANSIAAQDKEADLRLLQEAYPFFIRSLTARKILANRNRNDPVIRSELGNARHNVAVLCMLQGKTTEAEANYELAIREQKDALRHQPQDLTSLRRLVDHYRMQGENRHRAGNHAGAAELAAVMAKITVPNGHQHFAAAKVLGQCVSAAGTDAKLTDADRQAAIETYTQQALASVRRAIEGGFRDAGKLAATAELKVFSDHAEFRRLVAELKDRK